MEVEELKRSLEQLKHAIATGDGSAVTSNLAVIDEALQKSGRAFDPQLKHYLRNRSYDKALMFINEAASIPKGRCGGRKDFS